MADSTISTYVPKSFYDAGGQLSIQGDTQAEAQGTADAVATGIQSYVGTLPPAEAARFMAAVNAASPSLFAPDGKVAPDLQGRLEGLESALEAFKGLLVSGNDFDLLARVMIERMGQQRHEAVNDRQQLRQMAQSELMASAGELDKAASDMMSGAVASLVLSCVSAAVSIGSAAGAAGAKLSALKTEMRSTTRLGQIDGELASREEGQAGKSFRTGSSVAESPEPLPTSTQPKPKAEATTGDLDAGGDAGTPSSTRNNARVRLESSRADEADSQKVTEQSTAKLHEMKADETVQIKAAQRRSTAGDATMQVGMAVGHLTEGGANAANTMAQAEAKKAEARAKVDDAGAEAVNAMADFRKGMVDSLDDMIRQVIGTLKDLQEAKAERMRAFTHV